MIALDASVLIALVRRADPHHDRARAVLLADEVFEVHPVNLAEALVEPVRHGREALALSTWRAAGVEEWGGHDAASIDLARLRVSTGLRTPDCCVLLVAEALAVPLATFDARLARAARARGIEVLGAAG